MPNLKLNVPDVPKPPKEQRMESMDSEQVAYKMSQTVPRPEKLEKMQQSADE